MAVEPYLQDAFRIDPERGVPVIEIAVERYDDVFNTLDRAPFRRRDLSPDLKQFLRECSVWIPLPQKFAIEFRVTQDRRDVNRQADVVAGVRNYFAYLIYVIQMDLKLQRRKIAMFVVLSFVLLTVALFAGNFVDKNRVFGSFVLTGFTVGGWVFLWEAVSIYFIRWLDITAELARHDRLVHTDISFIDDHPDPPA
jgi:hypothetical protein